MKRFLMGSSLFLVGLLLGAGGLFVGLNGKQLNLFRGQGRDPQTESQAIETQIRSACANDPALHGAFVNVQFVGEKMLLRGVVARKEQQGLLEDRLRQLVEKDRDLRVKYSGAVVSDFKTFAIHVQLAQLQGEFADKGEVDPLRREVMRTTRLDSARFGEDGKLQFTALSIRNTSAKEETTNTLKKILQEWLVAQGMSAAQMPDIAVDATFGANPVPALRSKLAENQACKGAILTSVWFDAQARLHFEALIAEEPQREVVRNLIKTIENDPQSATLVKSPRQPDQSPEVRSRLTLFEGKKLAASLQQVLVEYARDEKKDRLRRIWIADLVPTLLPAGDENEPRYFFRVVGRRLETGDKSKQEMEKELRPWLLQASRLPEVVDIDQQRIEPKVKFEDEDSPVYKLQAEVVQRGLDGVVFDDAIFDKEGRLDLLGWHPSVKVPAGLAELVKETLAEPASLSLQPHRDSLTWDAVIERCQAGLASHPDAKRIRLDRLYFRYKNGHLQLVPGGVLLTDRWANPLQGHLNFINSFKYIRVEAPPDDIGCDEIPNPLAALQDQAAAVPDLDGVLLTDVRYDHRGQLQFDGTLGRAVHAPLLASLLKKHIDQNPRLVRATSGWSAAGVTFTPSPQTDPKRSELLRICQKALTTSPSTAPYRRVCLERVFFKYVESADKRELTLGGKATFLAKPGENSVKEDLVPFLGNTCAHEKVIAPGRGIEVQVLASPAFKLQNETIAAGLDGVFIKEAYYDKQGRLALEGMVGDEDYFERIQAFLEKLVSDKTNPVAPLGLASVQSLCHVPWQAARAEILSAFANPDTKKPLPSLFKHTRIEGAEFKYDGATPTIFFKGIRIYYGKAQAAEQDAALRAELQHRLEAKGIKNYKVDVSRILPMRNPVLDMQKVANERRMDGVVFRIGFDEKGTCCVRLPFMPTGQDANVRKLVAEFAKKHPALGPLHIDVVTGASSP